MIFRETRFITSQTKTFVISIEICQQTFLVTHGNIITWQHFSHAELHNTTPVHVMDTVCCVDHPQTASQWFYPTL